MMDWWAVWLLSSWLAPFQSLLPLHLLSGSGNVFGHVWALVQNTYNEGIIEQAFLRGTYMYIYMYVVTHTMYM